VGQDRLADDLLLLQLTKDLAMVGDAQPLLPGHERGQGPHLVADLHERRARPVGEMVRRNVDAVLP
jgi:hypothetical protein